MSFMVATSLAIIALASMPKTPTPQQKTMNEIPGYTLGTQAVPPAPLSLGDLQKLKQTLLITDEDVKYLQMSKDVLKDQVEDVLNVWYGFVASTPQLVYFFSNKSDGKPNAEYLQSVRKRFAVWILDTADAKFDQAWLDYQFEIGRRHHRIGKNKTDNAPAVDHIAYRYLPALIVPITTTLKPFLAKKGHSADQVEKMYAAWVKSITLQVILWSYPYVKDGDF